MAAANTRGRPFLERLSTRGSRTKERIQDKINNRKISANREIKEPKTPKRCQPRVIMPNMTKIRNSRKSLNFTSPYYNELAAVVYADIFGYPLTVSEAKLWAIRKVGEKYSLEKFNQATEIVNLLKLIPTIEAVFLTGSVAVKNAKKNADVDLMIITSSNTAWLTRGVVFLFLKIIKKFKNPICPNIFLDLNHLEIKEKNLYTAHEILQAKCLYDKNNIEKLWLQKNKWTEDYLPNAYKFNKANLPISNYSMNTNQPMTKLDIGYWILKFWILVIGFIEVFAFIFQYLCMKRKITNETMGWGYMFFHPNDVAGKILGKFEQRLLKYKE